METKKEEISQLVESLGNDPKERKNIPDFMEWMNQANPMTDKTSTQIDKKGCKSGKCGNNKKTFIIVGIILFFVMWAGYGIFNFIENLFK